MEKSEKNKGRCVTKEPQSSFTTVPTTGKKEFGTWGETVACAYLVRLGQEIVQKNFKCKLGEVDIISCDGEGLHFIEVKTRRSIEFGRPSEAVDSDKRRHILNVARFYLKIKGLEDLDAHLDIIEVVNKENRIYVDYLRDAIEG